MNELNIDLSRAKPHPKDRAVEPEDPMNLHAVELEGDPNFMLQVIVEEYARMGCDLETLIALSREPFYQGLHGLWLLLGQNEFRRRVSEILARTGIMRVRVVERQPVADQLVQIGLQSNSNEGNSNA